MAFHPLELLFPCLYLVLLLLIGFSGKKSDDCNSSFIAGGRRLTLPAFIATLVTTWYGGILGVGEFTYLYGISNWIVFGLPYYLFAILYAVYLAPKIRIQQGLTIPDQIHSEYGQCAGVLSAVCTFFMTLPAPYIVMLGLLISWMTGWNLVFSICLGTAFSMLYVLAGGFNAVVRTDKLQFILMFGGFIALLFVLVTQYGGLTYLKSTLPVNHLTASGGNSFSYILVWYLIAVWTFVDPGFHQRCSAAKSPKVARKGILISILFWLVFDLMTTSAGLYARVLLPDLENSALSFPILGHQVLHPLVSGLFLTGLLATIMSTIDSLTLLSSISIGHDLLSRLKLNRLSPVANIRLGTAVTAMAAIAMAIWLPSVVGLWYIIGTLFIPPMLLPMLSSYFPRLAVSRNIIIANLVFGFTIPLVWLIAGIQSSGDLTNPIYPLGWQPMFPGMAISLVLFMVGKNRATSKR